MPTLYAHYKFGQDVLNKLYKTEQKKINENIEYYNMFNQGFDNLYYYLFKWKYYRTFGIRAHKKNINLFFKNTILYIKENNLEQDSSITNMIYGFINHLTLDTIIHPFINYQVDNLNIPHTKIEFIFDAILFENTNNLWKNDIYKNLIPRLKFNNNLVNLLDYTFEKTYKEKNIGKKFNKSHNISYYIYRYFINDNYNIKATLYKLVDLLFSKKDIIFHKNTFNINIKDYRILNEEKNTWHHPNNKKEIYNYSLNELYNIALNICIKLNKDVYKVLNNKLPLEDFLEELKLIDLKNIKESLLK